MMTPTNCGGGANTNGAGTVTTGAETLKGLRCLLKAHKNPPLPVVVDSGDFRDSLDVANRQQLTREDGQVLISLTYEINNDSTIDAEFSVTKVSRITCI